MTTTIDHLDSLRPASTSSTWSRLKRSDLTYDDVDYYAIKYNPVGFTDFVNPKLADPRSSPRRVGSRLLVRRRRGWLVSRVH